MLFNKNKTFYSSISFFNSICFSYFPFSFWVIMMKLSLFVQNPLFLFVIIKKNQTHKLGDSPLMAHHSLPHIPQANVLLQIHPKSLNLHLFFIKEHLKYWLITIQLQQIRVFSFHVSILTKTLNAMRMRELTDIAQILSLAILDDG